MITRKQRAQRIRLSIFVSILFIVTASSFFVLQTMRSHSQKKRSILSHGQPDYSVEQFRYVHISKTGQLNYTIVGTKLFHFPQDDSFEIDSPVMTGLSREQVPMTLYSQRARIEDHHSKVHLYGDVNGNRAASANSDSIHLKTEYLLVLPNEDMAQTDQPVEMTMGHSVLTGVGMSMNNITRELRLLHQVRGVYVPQQP